MIEHLYNSFYKELTLWCRNLSQNDALAEDLVQEAYVKAINHISLLEKLEPRKQRAWLYRTTKNLYIDYVRHSSFETTSEQVPESPEESAYEEIDCSEMLNLLPDEEKMLFLMRYIQGYNSTEIAEILDMPAGTVRSKLSQARKHLRNMWN